MWSMCNITFKRLMYLHISKTEILQTLRRAKISCLFWRKIRHTKCQMLLKEVSNYKRSPKNRPWMPRGEVQVLLYSLTSMLDEVVGQRYAPAALPPRRETQYPLYCSLGGPRSRSGRMRKVSSPSGFDPRTFQPLTGRYTDCAVPAHC
jgi:hypothetical protein